MPLITLKAQALVSRSGSELAFGEPLQCVRSYYLVSLSIIEEATAYPSDVILARIPYGTNVCRHETNPQYSSEMIIGKQ